MKANQALTNAKIQVEIRIRDLEARGFTAEAIKETLNSHDLPFLDDLIDDVFRRSFQSLPSSTPAAMDNTNDVDLQRIFMRLAVEEARKCDPEDGRIHPKVGAVVVKDGVILATAFRGELGKGEHAEFTALEKKLKDVSIAGATVYATLEPCTTRNHPKVPCARRLIEGKVARVVFGMIDPNRVIQGEGWQVLREANVGINVFDDDFKAELEELNRDFIRQHRQQTPPPGKATWQDSLLALVYRIQLAWSIFDFLPSNLGEAKKQLQNGANDLFAFPATCAPPLENRHVEHIFRIAGEMKLLADRRINQSCLVSPRTGQPLDDEDVVRFRADAGDFIRLRLATISDPS